MYRMWPLFKVVFVSPQANHRRRHSFIDNSSYSTLLIISRQSVGAAVSPDMCSYRSSSLAVSGRLMVLTTIRVLSSSSSSSSSLPNRHYRGKSAFYKLRSICWRRVQWQFSTVWDRNSSLAAPAFNSSLLSYHWVDEHWPPGSQRVKVHPQFVEGDLCSSERRIRLSPTCRSAASFV